MFKSAYAKFKSWPLVVRILAAAAAAVSGLFALIIVLGTIAIIVDPEGFEEASKEQEASEEKDVTVKSTPLKGEDETEAVEPAEEPEQESSPTSTPEQPPEDQKEEPEGPREDPEPEPVPTETLDDQLEGLQEVRSFSGADIFWNDLEGTMIQVHYDVDDAITQSGICTNAKRDVLAAVEYLQEHVTEPYDAFMINGSWDGGQMPINVFSATYDASTIEAMDLGEVDERTIWGSADSVSVHEDCQD